MLLPLIPLALGSDLRRDFDQDVHSVPGFAWEATHEEGGEGSRRASSEGEKFLYASGRRSRDRASFEATLFVVSTTKAGELWEANQPALFRRHQNKAASGFPLGEDLRFFPAESGVTIKSVLGRGFLIVQVGYRGTGPRGQVRWAAQDRDGDEAHAEGLARRLLARVAGRDSTSAASLSLGGRTIPCITGPQGGRLVQLEGYCQARGWVLTKNLAKGLASFSAGSKTGVVPLAAKGLKLGSTWKETSDANALKGGYWFVPLNVLADF